MTPKRIAVLEVMVEMLVAREMLREPNPDQSLDDQRDVAVMMLAQRHTDDEMDGLLDVFDERLAKVRQHIEIVRQLQTQERH